MTVTMERQETVTTRGGFAARVGGVDITARYPVPGDEAFALPGPDGEQDEDDEPEYADFAEGADLAHIAAALIGEYSHDFRPLTNLRITYRWKRQGGRSGGNAVLGKCVKLGGFAKHAAEADFLVWLAADWVRAEGFTALQVEALVFHELLHIGLSDGEEPKPVLVGHDFELFTREIVVYGAWDRAAKMAQRAFAQPSLFVLDGVER